MIIKSTRRGAAFVCGILVLAAAAAAKAAHPTSPGIKWPEGKPIKAILVTGAGGREATLTSRSALRYIALAMRPSWRACGLWDGPPPPEAKGQSVYYATVEFADGSIIRPRIIVSRFPKALFFGRGVSPPCGIEVPMVPLLRPFPRRLGAFWRFLVSPLAQGHRTFGQALARPPATERGSGFAFNDNKFSPPVLDEAPPLEKIVFYSRRRELKLSTRSSLYYVASAQEIGPVFFAAGRKWHVRVWVDGGRTPSSWTVFAERWPPQLVFIPRHARRRGPYRMYGVRCPIYGQVPLQLFSLYLRLLRGGPSAQADAAGSTAVHKLAGTEALAGTSRPIRRLAFADATGAVVTLRGHRDHDSLRYLSNAQYPCGHGYGGADHSHVYAAVIWVHGERLPAAAWVAVERYPRELIFTTQKYGPTIGFRGTPQICVPLAGPLPPTLRRAYELLLHRSPKGYQSRQAQNQ